MKGLLNLSDGSANQYWVTHHNRTLNKCIQTHWTTVKFVVYNKQFIRSIRKAKMQLLLPTFCGSPTVNGIQPDLSIAFWPNMTW